jgi:hypothetical protein
MTTIISAHPVKKFDRNFIGRRLREHREKQEQLASEGAVEIVKEVIGAWESFDQGRTGLAGRAGGHVCAKAENMKPSILEKYFRERKRQWTLVREALSRMENIESPVSVVCSCVALKRWGDGDDRVAVLRPPPGYTANRHCTICRGTGALAEVPEENP